jgi:hypothetical protein
MSDQVVGLGFTRHDGECDNGVRALAAVAAGIRVCPNCSN